MGKKSDKKAEKKAAKKRKQSDPAELVHINALIAPKIKARCWAMAQNPGIEIEDFALVVYDELAAALFRAVSPDPNDLKLVDGYAMEFQPREVALDMARDCDTNDWRNLKGKGRSDVIDVLYFIDKKKNCFKVPLTAPEPVASA